MDSDFELEEVPCPVCNSNSFTFCFERPDHSFLRSKYNFPIVRCRECGLGYLRIRPTESGIQHFYHDKFYGLNQTENSDGDVRSHNKLNLLSKYAQKGSLLDVGCAGGEFVNYAEDNGWKGFGYEWSEIPSSVHSSNIRQGSNLEDVYPDEKFDVITSWAVLEHALNLQELVGAISERLKPGGIFIALVTNFNSIPGRFMRQDDVPRHLNFFTKKSMSLLLKQHNMVDLDWSFKGNIFSGTHREMLVFLAKRLAGESMESIVAQHRAPGRRDEFCGMLKGQPSKIISKLAAFDRFVTPYLDSILEKAGYGFTMTVVAQKK